MGTLTQNKFLTDEEIKQLKENLKTEKNRFHVLMVEFALYTGARSAEIVEVRKEQINNNGTVTIFGKKGSNDRTIPLAPTFFQKLKKHVAGMGDNELVFPVSTRMFRKVWAKVTMSKGKSLHSLRHTMGVKLYNNCEDIHAVKTVLGHRSILNTMVYLEFVEANKKLNESIKGMWSRKLDHVS